MRFIITSRIHTLLSRNLRRAWSTIPTKSSSSLSSPSLSSLLNPKSSQYDVVMATTYNQLNKYDRKYFLKHNAVPPKGGVKSKPKPKSDIMLRDIILPPHTPPPPPPPPPPLNPPTPIPIDPESTTSSTPSSSRPTS